MNYWFKWGLSCFGFVGGLLLNYELARGDAVQIHVRSEAQIAKGNVELGAIGDIKSTNADDEKLIANLILGESPAAGKSVVWTAAEISKRLRPYKRILHGAQFKLPDQIVIRRKASFLTRDELKTKIEEMLKTTLPDSSWEAQLIEAKLPDVFDISRDGSVQVVPLLQRPRGVASFEVQVITNGQVELRKWFVGKVKYTARVAVVQRHIDPRSKITEADIKWQTKDVTFVGDIPATEKDLESGVARMMLQPGAIVERSQLERPMAIRFGDEVSVTAGDGTFIISTRGIAQQNGFLGDVIKIKYPGNQKILNGVVVASGVVNVHY